MSEGACLCGAVRYEAKPPFQWMAHCHCSMCRKHNGGLHSTNLGVAPENFRWLQGEAAIVRYRSSEKFERSFCGQCGCSVPDKADGVVICPAGTLDGPVDMKPGAHIFVGSKSPMCEITDKLMQFEAYPPGFGAAVPPPAHAQAAIENAAPDKVYGSCLCGDVAFEVDGKPDRVVNCHCSRCRRSRGTAYATNFLTTPEHFRWMRGAQRVKKFAVPGAMMYGTAFCDRCGSMLPASMEPVGRYLIPVGVVDTPLQLKPGVNIYVDSKADWFDITDTLPQFAMMPPRERFKEFF